MGMCLLVHVSAPQSGKEADDYLQWMGELQKILNEEKQSGGEAFLHRI